MIPEKTKKLFEKQHYSLVGKHSAVQICRWTKKSIRGEGVCYKEKFYGIKSHRCCQMTPSAVWCQNKCLHCWRAIEHTEGSKFNFKEDNPKEIIDECIKAQRKLLQGFKILPQTKSISPSKADMKKWQEAQEPMQFAISLTGEPTLYPKIGELIEELKKRGKTSFLVTNGLSPEVLKTLARKKQLPTQLYVSVNMPNEKKYKEFHRSSEKNAWKKLNQTLELLPELKTRTVFRMNLILGMNMSEEDCLQFANLIEKAKPLFVEIKGYMAVGFARERIPYSKMPFHEDIVEFSKMLVKKLNAKKLEYKILDEHYFSRVVVLGKDKKDLKIAKV